MLHFESMPPPRWLGPLVAVLAACAAPGASRVAAPRVAPAPAPGPRAFLWEVTRPDAPERPLYLTGAVHAGRPGELTLPPALDAALARAEALVVEVDPASAATPELQRLVLEAGFHAPGDTPLVARLDAAERARLAEAIQRAGLPVLAPEKMRPWLLSTTLALVDLRRAGYVGEGGVDAVLLERAEAAGKEVVELETAEGQIRMLAGLPEDAQLALLREYLRTPDPAADVAVVARAWQRGDADAISRKIFEHADEPGADVILEPMFYARNRAMADRLAAMVGDERVHLAVVGAGHVVGSRGLLALLAARGFVVRQLPRE